MHIKPLKILSTLSVIISLALSTALPAYADDETMTLGDVNNDSFINSVDASCILSEYARISTEKEPLFTDAQKIAADVDNSGRIDSIDASIVLAYYAYCSVNDVISLTDYIKKENNKDYEKYIEDAQVEFPQIPL